MTNFLGKNYWCKLLFIIIHLLSHFVFAEDIEQKSRHLIRVEIEKRIKSRSENPEFVKLPALAQLAIVKSSIYEDAITYTGLLDTELSKVDQMEALKALIDLPFRNVLAVVFNQLLIEIDKVDYNFSYIKKSLEFLSEFAMMNELEAYSILRNKIVTKFNHHKKYNEIQEIMDFLYQNVNKNSGIPPTVYDLEPTTEEKQALAEGDNVKQAPKELKLLVSSYAEDTLQGRMNKLKDEEKTLNERIKGQPEVIQALLDMERERMILGVQTKKEVSKPYVLWLTGLPGGGKDTSVNAFIDAVHGFEGAYADHKFEISSLKEADAWKLFGSNAGYVGSSDVPAFIKFIVEHSGGRYKIVTKNGGPGQSTWYISEDINWKLEKGKLPGTYGAWEGVLYLNEFHNWPKQSKDLIMKSILENGVFTINNPGEGVRELRVPIRIVIADNKLQDALVPKKSDGTSISKPTSENLLSRWEELKKDPSFIRAELLRNKNFASADADADKSNSPELVNRVPDGRIILLRPLTEIDLRSIVANKLSEFFKSFKVQSKVIGDIEFEVPQSVIDFLQSYHFEAQNGGRALDGNIESLIKKPIMSAMGEGRLPIGFGQTLVLDTKRNENGTYSLIVNVKNAKGGSSVTGNYELPILGTAVDEYAKPISDQEIDNIVGLKDRLGKHVFGIQPVIDKLTKAILYSRSNSYERSGHEKVAKAAQVFAFLGLTSTGKTETPKAIARELKGLNSVTIDFSQVQNMETLKEKILGGKDSFGRIVKSKFMEEYDAHGGRILVVLDEIANAPKDVLKGLYDILREAEVTTFSDGNKRAMTDVVIVMTGNASEEWYQGIPRDIPVFEQMMAISQIYNEALNDREFQIKFLEQKFSQAFLARVGIDHTLFFPPMTFTTLRELSVHKLRLAIENLKPKEGKRGWEIQFENELEFLKVADIVETQGFFLWQQGASIHNYVEEYFSKEITALLLMNKIPSGEKITFKLLDPNFEKSKLRFELTLQNSKQKLFMDVNRKSEEAFPKQKPSEILITAFHETGHEIVRKALLGELMKSKFLSIEPGVTKFQDSFIRYLGISVSEEIIDAPQNKDYYIRLMAVQIAGGEAERIVSSTHEASSGQSNDLEKANQIAMNFILRGGLSNKWGLKTIPHGVELKDYLNGLTESEKEILNREVRSMLEDAQKLARKVILANLENLFIPFAHELAKKGKLSENEIDAFYEKFKLISELLIIEKLAHDNESKISETKNSKAGVFRDVLPLFQIGEPIADIDNRANKIREDQLKGLSLHQLFPNLPLRQMSEAMKCYSAILK